MVNFTPSRLNQEAALIKEPKRLAYIEDELEMIDLVRLILGRHGYTVLGANGGREGLELVRKEIPDLVLLDLMMPDMDGWDVYHQIKSDEHTRDIPVIVITAHIQKAIRQRCLDLGAAAFINKPPNEDELTYAVRKVLGVNKKL